MKNRVYFWNLFLDQKLCNLWRIERFGGFPKRFFFYHRLVHKKVMRFVKDWTFWVTKNLWFLYNFDTDFDFVLKISRFKIPQMYIYDFCIFTPILVRLRRHTLCECNLVYLFFVEIGSVVAANEIPKVGEISEKSIKSFISLYSGELNLIMSVCVCLCVCVQTF